ncbi:MAG: tetratricopeptide repeat protein [Rhizobiaceae bacterium]
MNTKFQGSKLFSALALTASLLLSACATDPSHTGSVSRGGKALDQMSVSELSGAVRQLGNQYTKRPKDKQTGLNYASALRMVGRDDQALAVMQQVVIFHPEDNQVLSAYGKALASSGNLPKALSVIERAQRPDHPDWKLFSAQGAILDQLGRPKQARLMYRKALDIIPGEPSVLSNLGMSYLLAGDSRSAETYLKKAISKPGADSRVRQNLALVVGLQGRFKEAEVIARGELPEADARQNIAYLRKMLSQQNAWSKLKKSDKKT